MVFKVNLSKTSLLNSVYIDFIAVSFERKMQAKIGFSVGNKLTDRQGKVEIPAGHCDCLSYLAIN